ncbi:3-phosphoshikimate 1-carboxyvinyltransferase [Thioalkalivibrio sp.]|uniref:3-phosphoshikimate 1-carboxyvinyltransferase n=1 Tax=Thioalkalivibrio sp. TaxID=2093813 RepID=UPI0039762231
MTTTFTVEAGGSLLGSLRVPGDKSISHRSIMLGALAEGRTTITGFLDGEDCLATLAAFQDMGVPIERPESNTVIVDGVGLTGLKPPSGPLDMGNSGTAMRLMCGVLAGQDFDSTLVGDASLNRRPMRRVTEPLARMGARIDTEDDGTPPLRIHGGQRLRGQEHALAVASAQVKSALLLAGLWSEGETCVTEPAPTRDHTERMLRGFGCPVRRDRGTACVTGGGPLRAGSVDIPADISSAAFFMVGASIAQGSDMLLRHVGVNPTRTGVIDILRLMGASIEVLDRHEIGGEPVADLRVRWAPLKGIAIPRELVPLAIDEFPALFVAAACAEGKTVLTGAEELRVKESDRIQVMADGLAVLGVDCEVLPDGLRIQGRPTLAGGEVRSHGDHRIAMAFAMAALRADAAVTIRDCDNVATSFPDFARLARHAGLGITAA